MRDMYDLGDALLIIATDRISAFDVVLPTPIPDKGKILTQMSLFWFEFTTFTFHVVHHFIDIKWQPHAFIGTDQQKGKQQ